MLDYRSVVTIKLDHEKPKFRGENSKKPLENHHLPKLGWPFFYLVFLAKNCRSRMELETFQLLFCDNHGNVGEEQLYLEDHPS